MSPLAIKTLLDIHVCVDKDLNNAGVQQCLRSGMIEMAEKPSEGDRIVLGMLLSRDPLKWGARFTTKDWRLTEKGLEEFGRLCHPEPEVPPPCDKKMELARNVHKQVEAMNDYEVESHKKRKELRHNYQNAKKAANEAGLIVRTRKTSSLIGPSRTVVESIYEEIK